MAAQAALIAETISGMKRAISGHQYCMKLWLTCSMNFEANEYLLQHLIPMKHIYNPPTAATSSSAKRDACKKGNRAGSIFSVATKGWVLAKRTVETKITADVVEQKVEHAGYRRSIIKRNPRRYDEDGEELDDDDDDSQADAEAASQNPYSEIKLEG